MKCKIFRGKLATVSRDINSFLEEHDDDYMFNVEKMTQSISVSNDDIVITIIYSTTKK